MNVSIRNKSIVIRASLAAACLAFTVVVTGCGNGGGKGASTAKEAVEVMFRAIVEHDLGAYKRVVHFGDGNERVGVAQFDRLAAQDAFYKKYIHTYEGEARKFEGMIPVHDSSGGGFVISGVPTDREMAGLHVKEDGDKATATIVVGHIPVIRMNGQWRVDLSKNFAYGDVADLEKETAAYIKYKELIGKSGYTAEKITEGLLEESL